MSQNKTSTPDGNAAAESSAGAWRFYVDRGGTFTDVVAQAPDGALTSLKLLSQDARYDDAALEAIRRCLGLATGTAIPPARVAEMRMGTTVATNALLERKGERVLLVTTRGLRDQLRIGYQNRPKLFALKIERPDMLYASVIEADERVSAQGEVLRPLDEDGLTKTVCAPIWRRRAATASRPAPSCSCTAIATPRMNAVPAKSRVRWVSLKFP
jgi:5-oxoprolinase (ATP-hydrolysing)